MSSFSWFARFQEDRVAWSRTKREPRETDDMRHENVCIPDP